MPFEEMVQICIETVLSSNQSRYSQDLGVSLSLEDLRCQEDVEPWLEVVEENRILEESNRKLFDEVKKLSEQQSEIGEEATSSATE